jgi:hypothetical protein
MAPHDRPILTAMQRARLDAALVAAERGWHIVPAKPGTRKPMPKRWEQRATTDPGRITRFWTANPDYNVAIACGPSGLLVVDLDQPKPGQPLPSGLGMRAIPTGQAALRELATRAEGQIPATHTVRTPSGGIHLYYRAPTRPRLGCTRGSLAPLIDTRGHGGCVIAPGSITPEGGYELVDDRDPATLPGWLVQALAPKPSTGLSGGSDVAPERLDAYVAAAVAAQVERVRSARRGAHNHTLFVAACRLGELVGARTLDPGTATHMLKQAAAPIVASDCDCTAREINATIASGLRTGAQRPRRLPTRHRRAA